MSDIKKINVNRTSLKNILSFCEKYAESMGIKIIYSNDEMCSAAIESKKIYLNLKDYSKHSIPFAFFHEIGHYKIFHKNLFRVSRDVYDIEDYKKLNEKDKLIYRMTVLKLEQWCDVYGEREANKYFKNTYCYKPYHQEYGKEQVRNTLYFK